MKPILKLMLITVLIELSYAVNPWEPEAKTDTSWVTKHERMLNQTAAHKNDIKVVFLGDSITEGWAKNGTTTWNTHYATRGSYNYGVGGDTTQNVLWRVENKEFDGLTPKFVVLMIGTNNFNTAGYVMADIAKGIKTIVDQLHAKMTSTKVLLLGVTPRIEVQKEKDIIVLNSLIEKFADNSKTFYLDMTSKYQDSPGVEKAGLFIDGAHMTEKGYEVWYETMETLFAKLYA